MQDTLTRSWGWILFRGILAVVFGIAAFALPLATSLALVTLFGAFALVDGIFALIAAFRLGTAADRWWTLLFEGIAGILAGLIAFAAPGAIAAALVYLVAAWAIVTGILAVASAIRLRRVIDNEMWLAISGILSIVFGVVLFILPAAGIVAWAWTIGLYALLSGVSLIAFALRLRNYIHPGMTHRAV